MRREMRRGDLRRLAEIAVAVALSGVLYNFVFYRLPNEGRITAGSMVPIFLMALRWGPRWGALTGVLAGVLIFFLGPLYVHPIQWLLDYPVAFGVAGVAGIFRRSPIVGVVLGGAGRFLAHLLSGVVFFASFAPKGMNPWLYSTLYNGSYMLPEVVISVVLTVLLVRALTRIEPAVR